MENHEEMKNLKERVGTILPDSQFRFRKPYQMGTFMEELCALVKSILEFLELQVKRTNDDYDLTKEIDYQKKRFKIAEEKYERLKKATPDLERKEKQAEEMEAKLANFNELKDSIEDYKELISEIEEKHKANVETYKSHIEANIDILAKITKHKSIKPKESIQLLANEISMKLKDFDGLLSNLIITKDKLAINELDEVWKLKSEEIKSESI